ncbi:hypothetical protein ZWY2020_004748 [Hordeum vulgare]|nr:hypothetical protein ZWY2020_004748 [Hordeum vulgare]
MGGLLSTPASSLSTSVSLGLGSPAATADDGSLKSLAIDAPHRSLCLAGAASPDTPALASSHGVGASSGAGGKRNRRPRVSAGAAVVASPNGGELGGGDDEVSAFGGTGDGSGVRGTRTSLRSGSWRPVEPDAPAEMELGPYGGGSGSGGKVHNEMPHWWAEGAAKRRKGISSRLDDYMTDSKSNTVNH